MPARSPFTSRRTPLGKRNRSHGIECHHRTELPIYLVAPDGMFNTHSTSMQLSAL